MRAVFMNNNNNNNAHARTCNTHTHARTYARALAHGRTLHCLFARAISR